MPVILQCDFPFTGPFGDEMAAAMKDVAESISKEPGFIWKVWTENQAAHEAGGIYLFQDRPSAEAYMMMHTERLKTFGVSEVRAKIFEVNEQLSRIDRATLSPAAPH